MLPPQRPDSEFQRWKRSRLLPELGPRNSVIWPTAANVGERSLIAARPTRRNTTDLSPTAILDNLRHGSITSTSYGNEDVPESSPSSDLSAVPAIHIADRLTTLPLPGDRNPLAVLAEASADVSGQDSHTGATNIASQEYEAKRLEEGYYEPIERMLKDEAPHIMGLISVPEAETLFDLYFTHLHQHLPLLDVAHSPPSAVARRNNFLFNAICCASARTFEPTLWSRLADFAKFEMERLPKEKNIDVIQGHCIHAMWNMNPPKHFELDMSWLRTGLAIRTAVDINLHRVALVPEARDGLPDWVIRAIARTWLGAYIVDQTMSVQLGKASSMRGEQSVRLYMDLLRGRPVELLQQGSGSSMDDLWIAALAEWTQLLSRAVDSLHSKSDNDALDRISGKYPGGLASEMALPDLARVYDQHFKRWRQRVEQEVRANDDSAVERASTNAHARKGETSTAQSTLHNIRIYQQYATLLIHSFSLERSGGLNDADLTGALLEYSFMEPNYRSVLHTARTAAIMLAHAPSPLAKSNCTFLNRLIDTKTLQLVSRTTSMDRVGTSGSGATIQEQGQVTQRDTASSSSQVADPERPLNLEAFGHLLDQDQGRSVWPPLPDSAWESSSTYPAQEPPLAHDDNGSQVFPITSSGRSGFDPWNLLAPGGDKSTTLGSDPFGTTKADKERSDSEPKDLHSWVSRLNDTQDSVYVPAAAIGTGLQNDLLFTQDSFWRSILEGLPPHGGA
ncbi:hypothetical protein IAU59_002946 [Kwoniella sp. CBS 9459]